VIKERILKYAVLDLPREWNAFENYGNRLAPLLLGPGFVLFSLLPAPVLHSAAEHAALLRCARERSTLVEIGIAEGVSALAHREAVPAEGMFHLISPETYWRSRS
jgi:hypothetical protein